MNLERKRFPAGDLIKIGEAHAWARPPGVGAAVELNSGGPRMVVVDTDGGDIVTCAWEFTPDCIREAAFDWRCLKPWEPN